MTTENNDLSIFTEKAIECQDDEETGFMARAWVQATMPHSKPKETYFSRKNGKYTLTMIGHPDYGVPYGSIPRLLMSWITTEAVRKNSPVIELGHSLRMFLGDLGLSSTGGKKGDITRVKDQMKRLFTCSISIVNDQKPKFITEAFTPIHKSHLWWDEKNPDEESLYMSFIELATEFYNEIKDNPVVFRMATLQLLRQSSLAVDMYIWITYRNSYAKKPSFITWESLQTQFGVGYPFTAQGKRNFKKKFIETLKKIAVAYPEAVKLKPEENRLIFVPGYPDIAKLHVVR